MVNIGARIKLTQFTYLPNVQIIQREGLVPNRHHRLVDHLGPTRLSPKCKNTIGIAKPFRILPSQVLCGLDANEEASDGGGKDVLAAFLFGALSTFLLGIDGFLGPLEESPRRME